MSRAEPAALFNGHAPGAADLTALLLGRGLHYGDGVFRTLLVWQSQPLDLDRHLAKLAADAAALDLASPDPERLKDEAAQLAAAQERAVLKILLTRKAGTRGYRAQGREADRLLLRLAAPRYPAACWQQGIRLGRAALALAAQPRLAGLKHLNRLEQVLASRDWPEDCEEVLVCDEAGRVVGGSRTNLFWVQQGRLCTADLSQCGVEGTTRNKIIELAKTLQVQTAIVDAAFETLLQAEEVFVCNALVGIWPVRSLAQRSWPAPGALTARLMQALAQPMLD